MRPHDLRHTHVALLIAAGEDPYVISRRLGHASIRSTVRYLHVSNAYISHIESPFDALQKGEEQGGQPCDENK